MKLCLLCNRIDKTFITDTSAIVDCIKLVFGTKSFDDILHRSRFCLSCCGRVYQLYQFFVISVHTGANFLSSASKSSCFACHSQNLIREKEVDYEIMEFISKAKLKTSTNMKHKKSLCCYSCYNHIDFFLELSSLLITFTELLPHLLYFGYCKTPPFVGFKFSLINENTEQSQ